MWECKAGPHAGQKGDTGPMHDDGYSRSDDDDGNDNMSDPGFITADNPGLRGLSDKDDISYSFTAEQSVIDICNGNALVAKRGPHTVTVSGKVPRTYTGVPATLE